MDFQLKIEVLLHHVRPSPFTLVDKLILHTLLARVCDATDLTDPIQWFHVLRSLLTTYAVLCALSRINGRARKFIAAIAKGMRRWFSMRRPLHIAAGEREECMNQLMLFMASELRQAGAQGNRNMLVLIEVLSSIIVRQGRAAVFHVDSTQADNWLTNVNG